MAGAKFPRSVLERIVREEVEAAFRRAMLRERDEGDDEEEDKPEKEGPPPAKKKGDAPPAKADDGKGGKDAPKKDQAPKGPPKDGGKPPSKAPSVVAHGGDGDGEMDAPPEEPELPTDGEVELPDDDGLEPEERPQSIGAELVGKTVQSIAFEPESRMLPGGAEVIVSFNEMPDPLRVLIGKSGVVKFYYKGLHSRL